MQGTECEACPALPRVYERQRRESRQAHEGRGNPRRLCVKLVGEAQTEVVELNRAIQYVHEVACVIVEHGCSPVPHGLGDDEGTDEMGMGRVVVEDECVEAPDRLAASKMDSMRSEELPGRYPPHQGTCERHREEVVDAIDRTTDDL